MSAGYAGAKGPTPYRPGDYFARTAAGLPTLPPGPVSLISRSHGTEPGTRYRGEEMRWLPSRKHSSLALQVCPRGDTGLGARGEDNHIPAT